MILKVGYPDGWNDLTPTLQHTGHADSILHNAFEPLVILGKNEIIQPMAAKSWSIDPQKRVFTFEIDTKRKFSNGTPLSAQHFKDSWEYSLKVTPKSSNNSLLDVLYKMDGFENHEKTGNISGIEVLNESTLRVTFKKSFRMALSHLSGSRMSSFLREGENFLGTGPYVINEISEKEIMLIKNEYFLDSVPFDKVSIKIVPPDVAQESLDRGDIDFYAFAKGSLDLCREEFLECSAGSENRHAVIIVNGQEGRIFSNPQHRKALQYLFLDGFTLEDMPKESRSGIQLDPQIFLPFQSGRITESKAKEIIQQGQTYVENFIKATQEQPLYFALHKRGRWLQEYLGKKGVQFSKKSESDHEEQFRKMYHKTYEPDIIPRALSVFNGDPDGIYHALGEKGAISSPMIHRKTISSLLEEGRKILDFDKLAPHYEKVAEAALQEVPFIHIGFLHDIMILKKDRVKLNGKYVNREDGRFTNYQPVE